MTADSREPRRRFIPLPSRDGVLSALEFGPADRPIDLVFSHANGFHAFAYRSILAPLAARRRVLAIDMRGHGRTQLPTTIEGRTSWLDYRDDLLALIEAEEISGAIFAGHSMGGCVSVLAAPEAPWAMRKLVLFDPVILSPAMMRAAIAGTMKPFPLVAMALNRRAIFPSRDAAFNSYRGRGAFATWPDEILRDYVQEGFRDRDDGEVELVCAPTWEASNFASHGHDSWSALKRAPRPVDILIPEHDAVCSVARHSDELPATDNVSFRIVAGTTHFLPMERPELAREAMAAV